MRFVDSINVAMSEIEPVVDGEDSKPGDLAGHPLGVGDLVGLGDAEENNQAWADRADGLPGNGDPRSGDSLTHGAHSARDLHIAGFWLHARRARGPTREGVTHRPTAVDATAECRTRLSRARADSVLLPRVVRAGLV